MRLPVYMDYNATTPCDEQVVEAMLPYFTEKFGNAASRHHLYGWQAEEAVHKAQEQIADLIGAEPNEIVFTSGATEACNLAIKGVFEMYASKGNHIITSKVEHKAVLDTCKFLEKSGAEVTYLDVDREGMISLDALQQAIKPGTVLMSFMWANNETGTLLPIEKIGAIARAHKVLFFTDATQAVGKVDVNVNHVHADLLCLSAHKCYGPKGIGALYIRRRDPRVKLTPQIHGGGHQKGWRSGTLNVPGIVGFGKAAAMAKPALSGMSQLGQLRDRLEQSLLKIEGTQLNGSTHLRLPQTSNVSFRFVEGEALMTGLKKELAMASGSACTSASLEPSYVLKAMGLPDDLAHGSLRLSLGRFTSAEEVDFAIAHLTAKVEELRSINPVWQMYKAGKMG